jgi:hypothetical protein
MRNGLSRGRSTLLRKVRFSGSGYDGNTSFFFSKPLAVDLPLNNELLELNAVKWFLVVLLSMLSADNGGLSSGGAKVFYGTPDWE